MILFVEDSDVMGNFVESLYERNVQVEWTKNFYDAKDSLYDDPGEENYDAVILDLSINGKGLPEEAMKLAEDVFPGWAFYKYIIEPNCPRLKGKTVFLSGFPEDLRGKIGEDEYKRLYVVTKGHNDIQNVIDILREFGVCGGI